MSEQRPSKRSKRSGRFTPPPPLPFPPPPPSLFPPKKSFLLQLPVSVLDRIAEFFFDDIPEMAYVGLQGNTRLTRITLRSESRNFLLEKLMTSKQLNAVFARAMYKWVSLHIEPGSGFGFVRALQPRGQRCIVKLNLADPSFWEQYEEPIGSRRRPFNLLKTSERLRDLVVPIFEVDYKFEVPVEQRHSVCILRGLRVLELIRCIFPEPRPNPWVLLKPSNVGLDEGECVRYEQSIIDWCTERPQGPGGTSGEASISQ